MNRVPRKRSVLANPQGSIEGKVVFAAKGVSKKQLKRILKAQGLDASTARMYHAIESNAAPLFLTETLILEDGTEFAWEFFDPVRLVEQCLEHSFGLRELYVKTLRDHPQPWNLAGPRTR